MEGHKDTFVLKGEIVRLTDEALIALVSVQDVDAPESEVQEDPQAADAGVAQAINASLEEQNPWFDFNDSAVTPISTAAIEKQFAGKESAYMLFYVRESVSAPGPAALPAHLVAAVAKVNEDLSEVRRRGQAHTSRTTCTLNAC